MDVLKLFEDKNLDVVLGDPKMGIKDDRSVANIPIRFPSHQWEDVKKILDQLTDKHGLTIEISLFNHGGYIASTLVIYGDNIETKSIREKSE